MGSLLDLAVAGGARGRGMSRGGDHAGPALAGAVGHGGRHAPRGRARTVRRRVRGGRGPFRRTGPRAARRACGGRVRRARGVRARCPGAVVVGEGEGEGPVGAGKGRGCEERRECDKSLHFGSIFVLVREQ